MPTKTKPKQTQLVVSLPAWSAVEGVESISNVLFQKWVFTGISYLCRGWFANKI